MQKITKAPRNFQFVEEDIYLGKPSIPYGIIRRLAYEERKKQISPYLRILFGEAGRRGDPWGGLSIEINGNHFHFNAGVKRWPHLYDAEANLNTEGKKALGHGVPGSLSIHCDWRWIQDELDLSILLNETHIEKIHSFFQRIVTGENPPPMFQAVKWSKWCQIELKPNHFNCTTIILNQLKEVVNLEVPENMPLAAFDYLEKMVNTRGEISDTDRKLNNLLHLSEYEIQELLQKINTEELVDWNLVSKGEKPLPTWLHFDSLFI